MATDIIHQHSERLDYYKGASVASTFVFNLSNAIIFGITGNFKQFYATKTERAKNQRREYDAQLAYRAHLQAFIDRWQCKLFSSPFSGPPHNTDLWCVIDNANRAPQAQSRMKVLEKLPELEPPEEDDVVKFK